MFYIYANGKSIYQPMDNNLSLIQPKLTLEMGKAGSLQFQIPPSNQYYNALSQLTTIITVEMDDVEIFRGRVLTNNRNFNNIRTVYCEGNLAYLVDSVQKAEKYEGKAHALFRKIIAAHNARVEASKQFTVGNITVENRDVLLTGKSDDIEDAETGKFDYKQIALNSIADEWQNTFEFIETCLIDFTGGYLRTRRSGNTTYIDLLADYNSTATQEIEFGKNLLDLTEDVSAEDVFTVLIPLGDENLTIESVNGGSDELVDADAVARYGRIVKTHVFDSVNTPETLLENGQRFLESNVNVPVTVTVKAVDMHLVDKNASAIFVGDKVHVTSVPHGMLDILTCTKIEYDLENPSNNTYTFGSPKQSLTERYRKDKAKQDSEGSRGGAGGGAGGAAGAAEDEAKKELDEFFDAWINVDKEAAHIDLGTLYKKFKEGVETLESSCGISLDAPSGNINIKTLRKEFDDLGTQVSEQAAYIDLLNNDLGARIALVASKHQELADQEASHYAEMTISANDQESKIAANTESIRNLNGQMTESRTNITQLSNDLQAQISLEAEHKKTLEGKITTNATSIKQVADDLSAQIKLEASHNSSQATKIASIEAKADANESAITLKADKTTINSKITTINGRLDSAEASIKNLSADVANIDTLISNKISSITLSSLIAKATVIQASVAISSGVSITAPIISASTSMAVGGKAVATTEYVDGKVGDFATQSWVNDQGFMKSLPSAISVTSVKASDKMTIGVQIVATQYWCMTTKKFATQDWVTEQLANYAKSDHTHTGYASSTHSHAWSSITNKPSSFTPTNHRHSISLSIANGHTHKTTINGTAYTSAGVSTNATHTVSANTGYYPG